MNIITLIKSELDVETRILEDNKSRITQLPEGTFYVKKKKNGSKEYYLKERVPLSKPKYVPVSELGTVNGMILKKRL